MVTKAGELNFYQTLTAAINDLMQHGYDSADRVADWISRIRDAAERQLVPESVVQRELSAHLGTLYKRMVDQGQILKRHPGASLFTVDKVKPKLRAELDRRIHASANMIKVNRQVAVQQTIARFQGWATSVPPGGTEAGSRVEVKDGIRKSLSSLPFAERRVVIDQGHKFTSELSNLLAVDGGAIAFIWHSHFRELNYNFRKDHKQRDGKVYAIRGSWALQRGLMKAGPAGYSDQITRPAEEVFCRCYAQYIYSISKLPPDMLTEKGVTELARVRAQMAGVR